MSFGQRWLGEVDRKNPGGCEAGSTNAVDHKDAGIIRAVTSGACMRAEDAGAGTLREVVVTGSNSRCVGFPGVTWSADIAF